MSATMSPQIHVKTSLEELWQVFAEWLLVEIQTTLKKQELFHMAIPGGQTPEALFLYLASSAGERFPWDRIHFWWTDERMVSPQDDRSNYRMAAQALLVPRKIPGANIHRVKAELDARRAAVLYAIEIEAFLRRRFTRVPFFDLVLLGVGEDGHIASLFPRGQEESPHPWSVLTQHGEMLRISLPFEVIEASSRIAFLVTGARKKEIMQRIFHPLSGEAEDFPASILYQRRPDAHWFLDSFAALSKLQGENKACRTQ